MAFTRAQATALLNKSEMRLFDDSRANTLRGLDRPELDARITRARAARDRARDLLKRQRGAARMRGVTGPDGVAARTARKEELLVEILGRFTDARKAAPVTAKKKAATAKAPAKKTPAKKAPAKKAATKKAGTKKAGTKKAPATRASASEATTKKATTRKAVTTNAATRKASKKTATTKSATSRRLTPERALEQTRKLLEAKQERDRTPQPWQSLDPAGEHVPDAGYQSPQAARAAQALHEGEARIPSIQGSNSTRDRINQGKRDHRGDNG